MQEGISIVFMYLFLVAAISTASELPLTTAAEEQEIQEIIALFMADEVSTESVTTEQIVVTEEPVVAEVAVPSITKAVADKSITITNAIKPSMLEYKHWTGTYKPEVFTITINNTEVAQGEQHVLPAETKNVDVQFSYSFMNGMRKGTKTVSYQLHENITQADITFSWKDDWQVLVDNGKAVSKIST
jgi:hypothetical protein